MTEIFSIGDLGAACGPLPHSSPPFAWLPHVPFARWIMHAHRPRIFVELGTHIGNSYFAFCDSVKSSGATCLAYAVDTWKGDEHAGLYGEEIFERVTRINAQHYASFSQLIRNTFDGALTHFSDGSIDLLHFDGLHTYHAVRHDFEAWLPKLSSRAVVLMHDVAVRDRDFGVWKLWEELSLHYPSFEFVHGFGLGVLGVGKDLPDRLQALFSEKPAHERDGIRNVFASLGGHIVRSAEYAEQSVQLTAKDQQIVTLQTELSDARNIPTVDARLLEDEAKLRRQVQTELELLQQTANSLSDRAARSAREVSALQNSLAIERNFSGMLSNKLWAAVRAEGAIRHTLQRYRAVLEQERHWHSEFSRRLDQARLSKAWQLMRASLRFGSLVIRGEDEGRLGFLRWFTGSGASQPVRSYDPFEGLPTPQLSVAEDTHPTEPPHEDEVPQIPEPIADPEILVEPSCSGSGDCAVVIPVKDSMHWVKLCLEQLFLRTPERFLESVILVDDNSTEETRDALRVLANSYPLVTVIRNHGPHGFGATCNLGASFTRAKYVLFLNSDCLVTGNTIEKLIRACASDEMIGLACSLANNAVNLSVTLPAGRSYLEVDQAFDKELAESGNQGLSTACTIVGHCLLVTRSCWHAVGGFDPRWGLGYGEETDLQMRARQLGFRGVVVGTSYTYHFGGGTFRYEKSREELQRKNFRLFMKQWGNEYAALASEAGENPAVRAQKIFKTHEPAIFRPDVLFILPGITRAVGGIQVVIDLANYLIRKGLDAKLLILGRFSPEALQDYNEPLLTAPLHADTQDALLAMGNLQPRSVVATLFTTALPAARLARARGGKAIYYVQGYEFFFGDGRYYNEVEQSYETFDDIIVTSRWLADGVKRHQPRANCTILPIGPDPVTFYPRSDYPAGFQQTRADVVHHGGPSYPEARPETDSSPSSRDPIRVAMVFRSGPDKGQWLLAEIANRLFKSPRNFVLTFFTPADYPLPVSVSAENSERVRHCKLPVDRPTMARFLRESDVFVDASLHEGFGLIPLEAMASGCTVVCSDSGGIRQYIEHDVNGFIVSRVTRPDDYIEYLERLAREPSLLARLREQSLRTARAYDQDTLFEQYLEFFHSRIGSGKKSQLQDVA